MLTVTIIPDCSAPIESDGARNSVLSYPLGAGTVLDRICAEVARVGSNEIWILADHLRNRSLLPSRIGQTSIQHVARADFSRMLEGLEASDRLLFIDPRHWPADGFQLEALKREALNSPGAIHAAAVGADRTGATERVLCDDSGRVTRIRRLYSGVTQTMRHRGVVMHSMLPVAAMQEIQFTTLVQLPATLAAAGIVTRDIPMATDLIDLANHAEYLAFSELVTAEAARSSVPHGYSRLADHVIVGRGALVHETVRIIGPAIVQPGALIEEDVTIIGPALIGAGAMIRQGAVIAQAVVPAGMMVESNSTIRHTVAASIGASVAMEADEAGEWSGEYFDTAIEPDDGDHPILAPELVDRAAVSRAGLACKRIADITISLFVILLTLPITLAAAVLIKLTSRGPLFFVHEREGAGGKAFPCLKFRTMIADAHEMQRRLQNQNMLDGPHFKITNDPRVTAIGRILRKYNIDELPQLLNVLAGHMSLVGPRPSPFRENQYCVPWRRARLSIRPGVTGIWQICRSGRHDGDFQQWIYYDMIYVRKMTPLLDLRILAATAYSLLTGAEIPLNWLIKTAPPLETTPAIDSPGMSILPSVSSSRPPLVTSEARRPAESVN